MIILYNSQLKDYLPYKKQLHELYLEYLGLVRVTKISNNGLFLGHTLVALREAFNKIKIAKFGTFAKQGGGV